MKSARLTEQSRKLLARRIRDAYEASGYSSVERAFGHCGVDKGSVYRAMAYGTGIKMDTLIAIASALGKRPGDFLEGLEVER